MRTRDFVLVSLALVVMPACSNDSKSSGDDVGADMTVSDTMTAAEVAEDLPQQDPGPANEAPVLEGAPATTAAVFLTYEAALTCTDPEGAAVNFGVGPEDSCAGDFVYSDANGIVYTFQPTAEQADTQCVLDVACSDGSGTSRITTTIDIQGPPDVAALAFGEFAHWASPVEDYIAINAEELGHEDFMKEIFDLAVYEDRLYFGYGDANLNLGRNTPIEARYWATAEPDGWAADFATDEEQIDRYRIANDTLMIPGVDATEDGFLGNAYTHVAGEGWMKSRTLEMGWHVHDIAAVGDTLYACGSGGTAEDYENSTVNAYLWRSTDGGENFEIFMEVPHPAPPGDHRYVHLLNVGGKLHVFGYYSAEGMSYALAYRLEDDSLVPFEPMQAFFALDTTKLSNKCGWVSGVIIAQGLTMGVMKVNADGAAAVVEVLTGYTLLDAEPLQDGRALLLYRDGDAYPGPENGPWTLHVGLTTNGSDLVELLSWESPTRPSSIAYWRGALYLGMADGTVQRAGGMLL